MGVVGGTRVIYVLYDSMACIILKDFRIRSQSMFVFRGI